MAVSLREHWLTSLVATAAFAVLITLAVGEVAGHNLGLAVFATIVGGFAAVYGLLPRSRLFRLALANGLAVYSCLYTFFASANFATVPGWALMAGLPLPVLGMIAGVWAHRRAIAAAVGHREALGQRQLAGYGRWLAPILLIGALTFLTNAIALEPAALTAAMLGAMLLIGAVAGLLARDIALFLIDTGLVFEGFWHGLARSAAPVFAFVTFYTFTVIVFAAVYRVIDRFSPHPNFMVNGQPRDLSFAETLYFSIVTLSTAGFGDIVPASDSARLIVSLQLVLGAVLILIGVSEILSYARNRGRDH